jgi:hypothetical protein
MKKIFIYIGLISVLILVTGCSTTKPCSMDKQEHKVIKCNVDDVLWDVENTCIYNSKQQPCHSYSY